MNQQTFAEGLYKNIISGNLNVYQDLFNNTKVEQATDFYWKKALKLYLNLSPEDKTVFFKILKQVEIDTVSNVLGVLDGSTSLEGIDGELVLMSEDGNKKINGELQDLFLEIAEDDNNS